MAPHTNPAELYNEETPKWFLKRIKESIDKEWLAFDTDFFKNHPKVKKLSDPKAREKLAKELYAKELHDLLLEFGGKKNVELGLKQIAKAGVPIAVYSAVGDGIVPNHHSAKAIELARQKLPREKTALLKLNPANHEFFDPRTVFRETPKRTQPQRDVATHFGDFYKKNKIRRR